MFNYIKKIKDLEKKVLDLENKLALETERLASFEAQNSDKYSLLRAVIGQLPDIRNSRIRDYESRIFKSHRYRLAEIFGKEIPEHLVNAEDPFDEDFEDQRFFFSEEDSL